MGLRSVKPLFIAAFSLFCILFSNLSSAQEHGGHKPDIKVDTTQVPNHADAGHEAEKKEGFNAAEVIFGHILDNHEYHITDFESDGKKHPVSIPLPVILYSPQRGFDVFMSSKFEHGHAAYKNYRLNKKDKVVPVKLDGETIDTQTKVYDFSITRNVVQMMIAMMVLLWLFLSIARSYKKGQGFSYEQE